MRFFDPVDRQFTLVRAAVSWLGTHFVDHQRAKGGGVDCVQLAAALYIECGHLDRFDPGHYTLDGGDHDDRSRVLEWLGTHPKFSRPGEAGVAVGDLLCFQNGRSAHHVGVALIVSEGTALFLHCLRGVGVVTATLDDPTWRKRLAAVFTPV